IGAPLCLCWRCAAVRLGSAGRSLWYIDLGRGSGLSSCHEIWSGFERRLIFGQSRCTMSENRTQHMATTTQQVRSAASKPFRIAEVETRLRGELEKASAEGDVLRGGWEPSLDSLRIVSILVKLEDLFDFDLRPEKIVRKGGYASVEEGLDDMRNRLQRLWQEHHQAKEES